MVVLRLILGPGLTNGEASPSLASAPSEAHPLPTLLTRDPPEGKRSTGCAVGQKDSGRADDTVTPRDIATGVAGSELEWQPVARRHRQSNP